MQAGLDSAHRYSGKLLNFSEFIALCVVQEHDPPVFVAELCQCRVELLHFVKTLVITYRIVAAGQPLDAVTRQHALLDRVQAAPGEASLVDDEQVIQNAAEPGSGLIDLDEIVELAKGLYKEFLEQVLRLGTLAGQPPGESVEAIEMRPDNAFECVAVVGDGDLPALIKVSPAMPSGAWPGRRRTGCSVRA